MNTDLDNALTAVTAAEATYNADVANVATIQTAIDTATAPLTPAKQLAATDGANFVSALKNLASVATAAADAVSATLPPAA
jgi:hypothetical protein